MQILSNKNEKGRTLTEILSVLAIIGILSVMAISGYKKAIARQKANLIANDGRIVYADTLDHPANDIEWHVSDIVSESHKSFSYMTDIAEHSYVKVEEVDENTCQALLDLTSEQIHFYTTENLEFTTCEETNEMIIDYGNNGAVSECVLASDCEGMLAYCQKGQCGNCDIERKVKANGDGCTCIEGKELTCADNQGNEWCCGTEEDIDTICGSKVGECTESKGLCVYEMAKPVSKMTSTSNCTYEMTKPVSKMTSTSNCTYTVYKTGSQVSLSETTGCPTGQYCYLKYSKDDCSESISTSGYMGTIYGVCTAQTSNSALCLLDSSTTTGGLTETTGCPAGQYCYLKYNKDDCSESISTSGYTGTIYGVCTAQTSNSSLCLLDSSTTTGGLTETTGCPASQYCYLKYSKDDCSETISTSGYTGTIYGACIAQTSNSAKCPASK